MELNGSTYEAISLTMTAMRSPWSGDLRMCSKRVVFPLPKKPDISVTGSCLNTGPVTAISFASLDFSTLTSNIGAVPKKDS